MIDLIGKKRIVTLFLLSLLCAGFWTAGMVYVKPMADVANMNLDEEKIKTAQYEREIDKLDKMSVLMKERGGEYKNVILKGFLEEQDRIQARRKIQDVRVLADIPIMSYKIDKQLDVTNSMAQQAGYDLRSSNLSFELTAYTDTDVLRFIELLKQEFQGQLVLSNMVLSKKSNDLDIGGGGDSVMNPLYVPRISAELVFSWNTIAETKVVDAPAGDMGGMDEGI